jgi:FixJ family two-component response regulator
MKSSAISSPETVFIVDDDAAICAGLSDLLESASLKTGHYSSAEEFLDKWHPGMRGCLVLDVRLPGMSGMELHAKLAESGAALPVIIMTAHGDMPMVRKALKTGAVEFLIKPFKDEELLLAVEQAFAQNRARRREDMLIDSIHTRVERLTDREREVMELVTAGMTNKEIAEKLFLSVVTIKLHRGQVMRKMQAESLADLVRMSEKIESIHNAGNGART